jgi:hypothetical protein
MLGKISVSHRVCWQSLIISLLSKPSHNNASATTGWLETTVRLTIVDSNGLRIRTPAVVEDPLTAQAKRASQHLRLLEDLDVIRSHHTLKVVHATNDSINNQNLPSILFTQELDTGFANCAIHTSHASTAKADCSSFPRKKTLGRVLHAAIDLVFGGSV